MATADKLERFQSEYLTVTVGWSDAEAERVPSEVRAAMHVFAQDVLDRASQNAPRRSGALIRDTGVVYERQGGRGGWDEETWRLRYRVPYARRQHFAHPTGGRWPGSAPRTRSRSGIASHRLWLANAVRDAEQTIEGFVGSRTR